MPAAPCPCEFATTRGTYANDMAASDASRRGHWNQISLVWRFRFVPEILPDNPSSINRDPSTSTISGPANLLRLFGSGQEIAVDLSRLTDSAYYETIFEAIRTEGQVRMNLSSLTLISEQRILLATEFLFTLGDHVQFVSRDGCETSDLLAAVLEHLEDNEAYPRVKSAALYAGALQFANTLEIAANRIGTRARQVGIKGLTSSILRASCARRATPSFNGNSLQNLRSPRPSSARSYPTPQFQPTWWSHRAGGSATIVPTTLTAPPSPYRPSCSCEGSATTFARQNIKSSLHI